MSSYFCFNPGLSINDADMLFLTMTGGFVFVIVSNL